MNGPRAAGGRADTRTLAISLGILAFAIIVAGAFAFWYGRVRPQPTPAGSSDLISPLNFVLTPGVGWYKVDSPGPGLSEGLVLRRREPDAWAVLFARDLKTRAMSDDELVTEALRPMRALVRALAHEVPVDVRAFDLPGKRIVFQGYRDEVLVEGECIAVQRRGFVYWMFAWSPAASKQPSGDLWLSAWSGWRPGDQRPDWRPVIRTFTGSVHAYALTDLYQRWEKAKAEPTEFDPSCDLALVGQEPGTTTADHRATALVLHLPTATDPAAVARAKLLARERDVFPDTTLEKIDHETKVGPAECQAWMVINSPARKRFALLGVIARPEGSVAVICDCDAARRSAWEGEFQRLVGSFSRR